MHSLDPPLEHNDLKLRNTVFKQVAKGVAWPQTCSHSYAGVSSQPPSCSAVARAIAPRCTGATEELFL